MPSTKTTLLALALVATRFTAAGPIGYRSTNTDLAGEGEPCGTGAKCQTGLTCKQEHTQGEMSAQVMTCIDESKENPPQKGKPCTTETGCSGDLECIQGTLDNPNDKILTCQTPPVGEGKPCTEEQRCDVGLICGSDQSNEMNLDVQTCQKPKTKKSETPKKNDKGSPTDETPGLWDSCTKDADCEGDLKCDVDTRPDMHTEDLKCQKNNPNEDDGKKGEGEPCSVDTDCENEMTCEAATPDTQNVGKIGTTVKQCASKKGLKAESDCEQTTECGDGLQCLKAECDSESATATCLKCQLPTVSTLPVNSRENSGIQPEQDSPCTSNEDCASNQECHSFGMTKMLQCQDKEDGSDDGDDNTCRSDEDCKDKKGKDGRSVCIKTMEFPAPEVGNCS